MSGPKTSHYALTAEQRRILERQRKIRIEKDILKVQRADVRELVVRTNDVLRRLEPLYKERGDSDSLAEVREARIALLKTANDAAAMTDDREPEEFHRANEKIRKRRARLDELTEGLRSKADGVEREFRDQMRDRIAEGFGSLSFGLTDKADSPRQRILSELSRLEGLNISAEQRARISAAREKASEMDDAGFLRDFYSMTVAPLAKECDARHAAYAAQGEEYQRLKLAYEANARELGVEPEEIHFSEDTVGLLAEKLRQTEAALREQEEQAYICRCVDEAMREMGYSLLGSREVVKRSGRRFRNELYLFEEGTAVNVTYSDDGSISMELGGMDYQDRIPDARESADLVEDMRSFCGDYRELEQRLLRKGVKTNRIAALPPDAQYAQIINVSDYALETEVEVHRSRKRKNDGVTERRMGE